jgi:hypothetical protein
MPHRNRAHRALDCLWDDRLGSTVIGSSAASKEALLAEARRFYRQLAKAVNKMMFYNFRVLEEGSTVFVSVC